MEAGLYGSGKCDWCDAPPGELVNGLVPCACWSGSGAPYGDCHCPWGVRERKRARRAAHGREDATTPAVVITDAEGVSAGGLGEARRPKLPDSPVRLPAGSDPQQ